jgi:predicted NAD/FAD-dependent oxidoreductase
LAKIAIIGAGLSGLSAAIHLKDQAEITIFEKARGVSGRLATRRAEPYFFDHGAQYFTARTTAFQKFIQPLIDCGVIERWNARYVRFDNYKIIERKNWIDDEPRYVGVSSMNKIVKQLSAGLNIRLNTKITSLKHEKKWQLFDEGGNLYEGFDWIISTAPSPQAAQLFPENFKYYADVKAVKMSPCFSLMLGFSKNLSLDFDAAHFTNSDLSWLAVNSHKPGRADVFTLMIHSSAAYAAAHIDADPDEVMDHLSAEASRIIGHDLSDANYKAIHLWRYANNATGKHLPILLDRELKLAACGDWCLGGRVEGAFTSAYKLAKVIKELANDGAKL